MRCARIHLIIPHKGAGPSMVVFEGLPGENGGAHPAVLVGVLSGESTDYKLTLTLESPVEVSAGGPK